MSKTQSYAGNMTMLSKFTHADFMPDGDLQKSAWKHAPKVKMDRDRYHKELYPESETQVASLWTLQYIYLAYWCKYRTLNIFAGEDPAKERWELWTRDVVEAFINPQPEDMPHYYEYEVSPNNQWLDLVIDLRKTPFNDASWDSHFDHATKVDEKNHLWMVEMRIPVDVMGVKSLQAGAQWRLNLYRADGQGPDTQRRFLCWSPLPGPGESFHQPRSFGIIKFEE